MWSQVGPLLQRTEVRSHSSKYFPTVESICEGKGLINTHSHILLLAVVTRGLSFLYTVNIPSLLRHEAKADF